MHTVSKCRRDPGKAVLNREHVKDAENRAVEWRQGGGRVSKRHERAPYSLFPSQAPSVHVCSPTQVSKSQRWGQDKGQDWEWSGGWTVNSGGSSERQHLECSPIGMQGSYHACVSHPKRKQRGRLEKPTEELPGWSIG